VRVCAAGLIWRRMRGMGANADEFGKQAQECRQLAATALKAVDKAFWLRLAEDWLKLAQERASPASGDRWARGRS
jgi:hypothetical protein